MAYLEGHGFVSPDYLAFSIFKNQLDELVVVYWQLTVRRLADFDTRLRVEKMTGVQFVDFLACDSAKLVRLRCLTGGQGINRLQASMFTIVVDF